MGRTTRVGVHANFDDYHPSDTGKPRVQCKHCGAVRAKNTTKQGKHLQHCTAFLNHDLENQMRSSPPPILPEPSSTFVSTPGNAEHSSQVHSARSALAPQQRQRAQRDQALFNLFVECNLPYNVVESPAFKAFVGTFSRSYKTPTRTKLSGEMLDAGYQQVKGKVFENLGRSRYLHFTMDESSNTNNDRVINLSCRTEHQAFYLHTKVAPLGESMTAEALKTWLHHSVWSHHVTGHGHQQHDEETLETDAGQAQRKDSLRWLR